MTVAVYIKRRSSEESHGAGARAAKKKQQTLERSILSATDQAPRVLTVGIAATGKECRYSNGWENSKQSDKKVQKE